MKTSDWFNVSAGKFISYLSSDFLGKCIGDEAKYEGVRLLFDGLQQPILNKQVHEHEDSHTHSIWNTILIFICISLLVKPLIQRKEIM